MPTSPRTDNAHASSRTCVGADAHAVERSGTSTLGVHPPERTIPPSPCGRHRSYASPHNPVCTPRVLASRRALGRLAEGGGGIPRLRARGTDSHASDVGHWLGMTPLARCAGRCTPRVLVPLRSTAWASPPTDEQRGCGRTTSLPPALRATSATLRRTTQCEHWAASQREARGVPRLRARGTDSHASLRTGSE